MNNNTDELVINLQETSDESDADFFSNDEENEDLVTLLNDNY